MIGTALAQQEKFRELLRQFDTGMLITQGNHQSFHGRPMAIAQVEDNCGLWFLTVANSTKLHEIQSNDEVLVTFQDRQHRYATLSGKAERVCNPQKVDELWDDSFKRWFPEGKEDPSLELIHVDAHQGEYWDHSGLQKASYMLDALKANASGKRSDVPQDDHHGRVSL